MPPTDGPVRGSTSRNNRIGWYYAAVTPGRTQLHSEKLHVKGNLVAAARRRLRKILTTSPQLQCPSCVSALVPLEDFWDIACSTTMPNVDDDALAQGLHRPLLQQEAKKTLWIAMNLTFLSSSAWL